MGSAQSEGSKRGSGGSTAVVAVAVIAAQALIAWMAIRWVAFQAISTPHCGSACDYPTLYWSGLVFNMVAAGLVVTSVVGAVALRRRGRWMLIVPILSTGLLLVAAVIATHVSRSAMLF